MASGRKVAMHQPNYIPWPGYFHKLSQADVFVFLDAAQYPRGQSFAPRNRVKTPNGVLYLTIPVSVPKGREGKASYLEVDFADRRWKQRHLKTLEQSYRRAPYFDEVFALFRRELEPERSFAELNIALVEACVDYLGIDTPRVRLSETVESFGEKTRLIIDLCRALDASVYLSGSGGGRAYNDEALLNAHDISLEYDHFVYPEHAQLWGDFEPNLSVLDLLFNCGPASRELVVNQAPGG
jgi:hypothetical protein